MNYGMESTERSVTVHTWHNLGRLVEGCTPGWWVELPQRVDTTHCTYLVQLGQVGRGLYIWLVGSAPSEGRHHSLYIPGTTWVGW